MATQLKQDRKSDQTGLPLTEAYKTLGDNFSSTVIPTPCKSPFLLDFNENLAQELGLGSNLENNQRILDILSGTKVPQGAKPKASFYAGHQFGALTPDLGDGRVYTLGILDTPNPAELQIKGAGATPYARGLDGRYILKAAIREYLGSEAAHHLGIPTTRALSLVGSPETAEREGPEPIGVLARTAPSFLRFGHIEGLHVRRDTKTLEALLNYAIEGHFPEAHELSGEEKYSSFFYQVIRRTAILAAKWQAFGFCHGVINTDNMSLLGLTLDYGPFGFMETYDPRYVCNASDVDGRYAYKSQPEMVYWNLQCLARPLSHFIQPKNIHHLIKYFIRKYQKTYLNTMLNKLGLKEYKENDQYLIRQALDMLHEHRVDYTIFFRALSGQDMQSLRNLFTVHDTLDAWLNAYTTRLESDEQTDAERQKMMLGINPKYILRNYMAQQAFDKIIEDKDMSYLKQIIALLSNPFEEQAGMGQFAGPSPEWAEELVVSCIT